MPLDDELMRNQTETASDPAGSSAERAGVMREEQRNNSDGSQSSDLRSARISAMRKEKSGLKGQLATEQKSLSFETSKLLQSAWRSLIPSFGTSFLYVYVHLFLQQIFGKKLFAPLGEEWLDRPNITIKARERMSRWLKILENFGVGCLSIVLLIAIIFAFAVPALIVEVVTNPLRTFMKTILEGIWSFLSGQ
ncbi:hypothetical protein K9M09_02910 [Patescibacteria group bacterium]|nr:hypothetical protein [Patescibacteria group bacterium]